MYICICNGVTEREIRGAAELGCRTVSDLGAHTGVGTCCGKCVAEASRILREQPVAAQAVHQLGHD